MENANRNQKTIRLDDVRQNNVVWTDLNRDLSNSIFEDQFRWAMESIQRIIYENNQQPRTNQASCRQCKSRECSSCYHRDDRGCDEYSNPPVNRTMYHTAIPFIGERGTGKTSVMFSVLEYLKRYRVTGSKTFPAFKTESGEQRIRFITFEMIDAAMLTSAEDVMEMILSQMLGYLEELSDNLDFRDLYRQIDELHKDVGRVYRKKPQTRDEYGLTSLQQLADSKKVASKFSKLVDDFRKTVSRHIFDDHECFLVIALDDLDLYQGADGGMGGAQFALLEHIYNYLRIPGVIMLLTFNEYILRRICNRHFADIYFGKDKPKEREYRLEERKDIEQLTAQFMSKLFPQEQRIYLPEYSFVATDNKSHLWVTPEVFDHQKKEVVALAPFSKNDMLHAKEFILRLIAYRTGIYFDAAGTKFHFFEARNLRELGEIFQSVNRMKDPGNIRVEGSEREEEIKTLRSENAQTLLEYFYNQYALKRLNAEEHRLFNDMSMLPVVRQNVYLIDRIRLGTQEKATLERWQYSYGELLRHIYCATRPERCEKKNENNYPLFSKELVHCILGARSAIMSQMVRANEREEFTKVIGSSIAGKWSNQMIPSVTVTKGEIIANVGSMSKVLVRSYFNWKLPEEVRDAILHISQGAETVKEYLEALLLAGMFFTGFEDKKLQIRLEPDMEDKYTAEGSGPCLELYMRSDSDDHICFNILNFVLNLYNADVYLLCMQEKFRKLGREFADVIFVDGGDSEAYKELRGELAAKKNELAAKKNELSDLQATWINNKRLLNSDTEDVVSADKMIKDYAKGPERIDAARSRINELEREVKIKEAYINLASAYGFNSDEFMKKWEEIVKELFDAFEAAVDTWETEYGEKHAAALPVEHFDMMYNIIKRLANRSYYDIPEQMNVDEVYHHCVALFGRIVKELKAQDLVYKLEGQDSFANAFRECIFFKRYAGEGANPYIGKVQQNMMEKVLGPHAARRNIII